MAAAATDLFQEVGTPGTATTLSSPGYTIGDVSVTVGSTSGWPTATGVTFAIDRAEVVNGVEVRVDGTYCEFVGTVASGTSVTNVDKVFGTAQNYAAGALTRVYIPVSSERENRIVEGILTHADQDGTLKAGAVDVAAVLASNVVTTAKMADGAVTPSKLALSPGTNYVGTSQTTTSVTYADLATVGPAVTANIGTNGLALVTVTCHSFNSAANDSFMSFAVSGSSTVAASDDNARVSSTTSGLQYSTTTLVTGLTAGSNVFTSKYRVASGTGSFLRRTISVVPL